MSGSNLIQKHPAIQLTDPEVFIVESLKKKDVAKGRLEGQLISDMLRIAGKSPKYYYFESKEELQHLVGLFRASKCRFLHVSVHANSESIEIGEGELKYDEFAEMFRDHLKLRRLFVSACEVGNSKFVDAVASRNKGMHSIVAPVDVVRLDKSSAFWTSFYISVFSRKYYNMRHADVRRHLGLLSKLFDVNMYMASYSPKPDSWVKGRVE